jgi:anti-sigma factor RsiW
MIPVTCAAGVEQLMDYLEGVLSADVRAALDAHVAGCPKCLAFVESYTRTPVIFRQATAVALPAARQESLRAFLRAKAFSKGV